MDNKNRFSNIVSVLSKCQEALNICEARKFFHEGSIGAGKISEALELLELILGHRSIRAAPISKQDLKTPIGAEIVEALNLAIEGAKALQARSAAGSYDGQLAKKVWRAADELLPKEHHEITHAELVYNSNSHYKGD